MGPPRQKRAVFTVQTVPFRGRLVLERTREGALRLHNGLGAAIAGGRILTEQGEWAIPPIPEGGSAEPGPASGSAGLLDVFLRAVPLRPGEFAVQLAENPLLDQGGKRPEVLEAAHLLRGYAVPEEAR